VTAQLFRPGCIPFPANFSRAAPSRTVSSSVPFYARVTSMPYDAVQTSICTKNQCYEIRAEMVHDRNAMRQTTILAPLSYTVHCSLSLHPCSVSLQVSISPLSVLLPSHASSWVRLSDLIFSSSSPYAGLPARGNHSRTARPPLIQIRRRRLQPRNRHAPRPARRMTQIQRGAEPRFEQVRMVHRTYRLGRRALSEQGCLWFHPAKSGLVRCERRSGRQGHAWGCGCERR